MQAAVPTVVVRVSDGHGRDVSDLRVSVDGREVASRLDGLPIEVDPGTHVFRFEPLDPRAGAAFEDRLVIAESEKDRVVTETLPPLPAVATEPTQAALSPAAPNAPPHDRAVHAFHLTDASCVLGAVGVAALALFTYFTVSGTNEYAACVAHSCSASQRSDIATRRGLAWTSLGAGVVSLGLGIWLAW